VTGSGGGAVVVEWPAVVVVMAGCGGCGGGGGVAAAHKTREQLPALRIARKLARRRVRCLAELQASTAARTGQDSQ